MKTLRRRRMKNKTDYGKRIRLLKSGVPRIVVRRTNKYILAQYVTSKEAQDKIELGISSFALMKYGWPEKFKNSLKSLPASYFTGLLLGKMILDRKGKKPIVDFGMIRTIEKNRFFAFLKGLKDSGIDVKCDEEKFPVESRIKGKNLKEDFSKYFEDVKSKIENSGGKGK